MENLTRTAYRDPVTGAELDGSGARREVLFDLENYHRPLERTHGAALHAPGVATGLEVRATAGTAGVRVLPGVGLTPAGDHVVLVTNGRARLGTAVLPVAATGVKLATAPDLTGEYLLTVAWAETVDVDAPGKTDHTPRFAFTPPAKRDDTQLVLATIALAGGVVRSVDARGRQVVPARVGLLGTTGTTQDGELRIGSAEVGSLTAVPGPAWELRVGADAPDPALTVGDGEVHVPGLLTADEAAVHDLSVTAGRVNALTVPDALVVEGESRLQGPVYIGVNQGGPFLRLNDDTWFSDPQDGTLQVRNHDNSDWGTMVGKFTQASSAAVKKDIELLPYDELRRLHADVVATPVARFRYRGADPHDRKLLGLVLEHSPPYLRDGIGINPVEYAAVLHAAVVVLSRRVDELTARLAALAEEGR